MSMGSLSYQIIADLQEMENGSPKVARVDVNHTESSVAIYFHIKGERFFIVVNIPKEAPFKPEWVWVESGHRVYLTATSEELSYKELSGLLYLQPLSGWSKGDLRNSTKFEHKFSRVSYEPNENEAHGLEGKLLELLVKLENDIKGVREITKESNAYISICRHQYISGNVSIHFDLSIISRLNALKLEVDIDTYICGNEIR